MKKFYKFLLIIFANLVLLSSAESATFYVNVATGNNANSSSQARNVASPWQTVQYAIDNPAVVNGDNIVVAEGTYDGFNLTKRVNVIGAWKGGTPTVNTIFNSIVTLNAPGGSSSSRMMLKNLRVAVSTGDAIDMRHSFVTLENVFATATTAAGVAGLRVNSENLQDLKIEACNFNACNYAGIFFPSFSGLDGFTMRNTTVNDNGYFGIVAFQRRTSPTMIENVEISHCAFINNNPTNQIQGHTIYFEKLRNSVFENISVVMPATNIRIGIDINLLARTDYANVEIRNSRIFRATPGSGIWIQARNDLFDPPAALTNAVIRGMTFENCDTLIAFNRQISNMTVDKCDLSNYLVYGLVNFTDQGGTINASNNKWQNGVVPDTTVISGGLLVTGNNIISFMPSTDGIFIGMGIVGPGIPPGTTVIGKSPNTITMSNPATMDGFVPTIGFAFNFATSTDIVRTSLNFVQYTNPMPNSIVNQNNFSFPTLASALAGTAAGGTIWNVPFGTIPGTSTIPAELTLISPGAGFLHSNSLTTFDNLTVTTVFRMGSDFAVSGNLNGGNIVIGNHNTLAINGNIASGTFTGGPNSDMFFGGAGPSTTLPNVSDQLRTLQVNRASGIALGASLFLNRLLFLQTGIVSIGNFDLMLGENATIFNPTPASSFVQTNGTGVLRKFYSASTPTAFKFPVGAGGVASPVNSFFTNTTFAPTAYLDVRAVNAKQPQNQCATDYLNRYWVIDDSGIGSFNADLKFTYVPGDVVGTEANIYGARYDGFGWTIFTPVNPATHTFTTNNITSFGDFTGGGRDCISNFATLINTKVFLEGAYVSAGTMRLNLNTFGLIPLSQPYNTPQFNYTGTETVAAIPADVVDWIYLEIRASSNGGAIPSGRRAAFLKSDGSIVDLDGVTPVKIEVISGNYYIVVGHRNHLPVMSAGTQLLNTTSALYDFTTGLTKYFGGDAKALTGGFFGMYGGDANRSFVITATDYNVVTANLGAFNYNPADLNLSGVVTATDYNFVTGNIGKFSRVPNYP